MDRKAEIMKKKRESGISWDIIEQDTGIPSSTIRNHLTGRVVNPNGDLLDAVESAIDAWKEPACAGEPEQHTDTQNMLEMMGKTRVEMLEMSTKLYEQQIEHLKEELAKAEARIKRLTIALAVCIIFFILLMTVDVLNRDMGWFRVSIDQTSGFLSSRTPILLHFPRYL